MNRNRNLHAKAIQRFREEFAKVVKKSHPDYSNSAVACERPLRPSRGPREPRRARGPKHLSKLAGDPTGRRRDDSGAPYGMHQQKQNMNATSPRHPHYVIQESPIGLDPVDVDKIQEDPVNAIDRGTYKLADLSELSKRKFRQ